MKAVSCTIISVSLMAMSAGSLAYDLEFSYGFGLSTDPIAEYTLDDGSAKKLVAGEGVGIMIGADVFDLGAVSSTVKVGYQYGVMFEGDSPLTEPMQSFSYVPTMFNLNIDLGGEVELSGGLSYLLLPHRSVTRDNGKDKTYGESDLGYNGQLTYTQFNRRSESYYFVRYTTNTVTYKTIAWANGNQSDISGLNSTEEVTSIQLGFGARY